MKKTFFLFPRMRLKAERGHQISTKFTTLTEGALYRPCKVTINTLPMKLMICSSVNSTYPSQHEEMLVSERCIAIGCNVFLSSCKRVIALQAQKDLIGKVETSLK